jgi:hypothetical protein
MANAYWYDKNMGIIDTTVYNWSICFITNTLYMVFTLKKKKSSTFKKSSTSTLTSKNKKHRKWSMKYKKSINCKKPRGFSQKQHCKYGRKTINEMK